MFFILQPDIIANKFVNWKIGYDFFLFVPGSVTPAATKIIQHFPFFTLPQEFSLYLWSHRCRKFIGNFVRFVPGPAAPVRKSYREDKDNACNEKIFFNVKKSHK